MHKILKYSLITFTSIILIASIGLTLIVNFVDPNQYKPIIEKTVSKATNREFHINGKLSWVIYPNLGVKIENVELSSPKIFNDINLMEFSSAEISVGLISLLQKHIVFKKIDVSGLKLHFIVKNHKNNWEFLSNVDERQDNNKEQKKNFEFILNNFKFNDLNITYDNYDIDKHYQLKNVKLVLDSDFNGGIKFNADNQIVDIKNINFNYNDSLLVHANFKLKDFSNYKYDGQINIKQFALNKIANDYNFRQLNKQIFEDVKLNLAFIGNKNSINIENLKLNLSDILTLNLAINVKDIESLKYIGRISVESFDLNNLLNNMNINKNKVDNILFKKISLSQTNFLGDKNNIKFDRLLLNISNYLKLNFDNLGIANFSSPNINTHLTIPEFNLHQVILALGMEGSTINNINWLNKVILDSNIKFIKNSLSLSDFKLKISDSNILGSINVGSFKPFNVKQSLLIDNLDLSNIINLNGFKVINKNIRLDGNFILLDNINNLTAKQYMTVDDIKVKGLSIDELINEFDKDVLRTFNKDIGEIINSSPDIIKKINFFKNKVSNLTKEGAKDYSKISNLGNLKVNINIVNGVVNKSDFNLIGPIIISNGSGTINIVKKSIDYQIHSKCIKANINPEVQKLTISSNIKGTFADPNINLDWLSLQNQILKIGLAKGSDQVQKIINKNLDANTKKVINDVGNSINNAIVNLFGNKK